MGRVQVFLAPRVQSQAYWSGHEKSDYQEPNPDNIDTFVSNPRLFEVVASLHYHVDDSIHGGLQRMSKKFSNILRPFVVSSENVTRLSRLVEANQAHSN